MQWCQSISKFVRVHPRRRQQAWSIKFINRVWGGATTRVQGQNAWSGRGQSTPKTKDVQCNGQNMPTFCDTVMLKKTKVSMENRASVLLANLISCLFAQTLEIQHTLFDNHLGRTANAKISEQPEFQTRSDRESRQKNRRLGFSMKQFYCRAVFFAQFRMWYSHQDIQQHTIKYIVGNGSSADTISIYEPALAYACKLNEPNSLQSISDQPTKSCANESCTSSRSNIHWCTSETATEKDNQCQ